MPFIQQTYESLQKLRNDLRAINALFHTAMWRDFITLKSTRRSSEMRSVTIFQNESTAPSDLLYIHFQRSKSILFIDFQKMASFICFISRRNGDLSGKTTTRPTEFMPTTGKTLEESRRTLATAKASERTGYQQDTSPSTLKAEVTWRIESIVTGGKKNYITLYPTKCILEKKNKCMKSWRTECPYYHTKQERRVINNGSPIHIPS